MTSLPKLPVSAVLPALQNALATGSNAVLVAPPGAGKTTLAPLSMLDATWCGDGRIILLEPRRLAARAAARRMAALIDEEPGEKIGYVMRMERRISPATRIAVVTEGVLSRMILDDPELSNVSAIVFDEFHERSLDGDFALALALDVQRALRPELRLLVMSATLDGAAIASLMGNAPIIESAGQSFPVEIRYEERPAGMEIEDAMAKAICETLTGETGSILAFLPGQREIQRTIERIGDRLPANVDIAPLYGQMNAMAQDAAIQPAPQGRRKVVLATAIAETSITIDGVRVVIDSGLSRLPKYEPATGITRLETVRVAQAAATQRAGRAGRTQPGIAIRLWREAQTAALLPFTPPEILQADLSGLLLDCAAFGVVNPADLAFLDSPPAPALAEASNLLRELGAIDANGCLTQSGRNMRKLALPARLSHMVTKAAPTGQALEAAMLALLLTERGLGGGETDLELRLECLRREKSQRAVAARHLAQQWARQAGTGSGEPVSVGALLLYAWPDRIAMARGERGRFVLANGRGAVMDAAESLAGEKFLVIADLQGKAQNARIAAAAPVSQADIRAIAANRIERRTETIFDPERRIVRVREVSRLGAIVLGERMLPPPSGNAADEAILGALREYGLSLLPWNGETQMLRHRLQWLHRKFGAPWPDMSDEALLARLDDWLRPFLSGEAAFAHISPAVIQAGLTSLAPQDLQRRFSTLAPICFAAPSGSHVSIRYDGETPVLAIRVQELFGLDRHPSIAEGAVPLTLELLSPAHRPIQTTCDLPGFWRGSWKDVRAQMRGRYPKHDWPDDPLRATPTTRSKPKNNR